MRCTTAADRRTPVDSKQRDERRTRPGEGQSGSLLAAVLADEAFDWLDAPVKRVTAPDTPVPFSPPMESFFIPNEENLIKAIKEIT